MYRSIILLSPILSYDVWFYISHIILHKYFYSSIHHIHHSSNYKELRYLDTHKGHYLEGPFQGIGVFSHIFYFIQLEEYINCNMSY